MRLRRHLFLVGFMGAGKTRLGGLLSARLEAPMTDLDESIEAAAGMAVRAIFERYGETYFRELEHMCLRRLGERPPSVVATGGGAFVASRNRRLIENLGFSVWIDVGFDTIVGRMSARGRQSRPLLPDEGRARTLFSVRRPDYRRADLSIEVGAGEEAEAVAARILELIRERNCVIS